MNILYITNYFPPEVGAGPRLPFEMGQWLVNAGHNVTVITNFPRYNLPVMPKQYRGRLFYKEEMGGMQVVRINAPNFYGMSKWSRGLVQLLAPPVLLLRALRGPRPDVIFTDIPPLLLGIVVRLLALRFRAPCVAHVMDLFPQAAVDLGLISNRLVIRFFEAMERHVYRNVSALTTAAEGYAQFAIRRGAQPDKIFVVPHWADIDEIRPSERRNEFRATHGLGDNFVVTFAGVMGFAQGLGMVVEAARELATEPGLVFLMVGGGVEQKMLERQAAGLNNVRFLPMQPKHVYPQVLAASNVCLSTLHPAIVAPAVPSKIITIMAAGRPVVAAVGPSDTASMIRDAQCGLVVPPGDHHALAAAILELKRDSEAAARMGANGRLYAERHLSRDVCLARLEEVFRIVTGKIAG
jgi:colanic acid biosynthesis glycosyl transferase WcaI